jgi:hypothetical protein
MTDHEFLGFSFIAPKFQLLVAEPFKTNNLGSGSIS